MEREVKIGHLYKHFKGDIIKVLLLAQNSETLEEMVVYKHQNTADIWVRSKEMFISLVDKEKYPNATQEYRFELFYD